LLSDFENLHIENGSLSDPNLVKIGEFVVDVDITSRDNLKRMRKYLPKNEYQMLKGRKAARMDRA
jgi:hypothetical protein